MRDLSSPCSILRGFEMRRHLNVSLESASFKTGPVVSLEEEQIMLSDAADLAADVGQELNEVNRVIEVSDALEDLAVIADQIEQASPTEIALMETAGDMAVAGTDIEAEQIVPSLESYKGKRIAVEDFRQTAETVWKNIQEFVKNVYDKIEKFFYNVFGVIPNMRKRLDKLSENIKIADNKIAVGTRIEFKSPEAGGAFMDKLAIDGKIFSNDNEFLKSLRELVEMTEFVYGANIINRNTLGARLADLIASFDPAGDMETQGKEFIAAVNEYNSKQNIPGPKNKSSSGIYELNRSHTLLGGGTLVEKTYVSQDSTTLGTMDRLRHSGIIFENISLRATNKSNGVPLLTTKSMTETVKSLNDMLDLLEEYKRGGPTKAVDATRKKLEAASKKAEEAYNKLKDDAPGGSSSVSHYRAALNFNVAYAGWVHNPAVPYARYAVTTINAIVSYLQTCLTQYK